MFKKLLSIALVTLIINLIAVRPAYANSKEEKQARFAAKVKDAISRLGTGMEARVEVKLRDKTKLKGYIHDIGKDHFVVADSKTGSAVTIAYAQVKQVKGNNLSTGAKIAIGVGIGIGVALLIWAILIATSKD